MDRVLLDKHYEKILTDNRSRILTGGTGDRYLVNAPNDNRMSLVVLIRISSEITDRISDCIRELKAIEPDLYYYPGSDLHITVMDILKGEEGRQIPANLDSYIRCIEGCCAEIAPFQILFDGLTASDNAVMVRGYYEDSLLQFRESLRNSFARNGLPLEERYKTVSSHITISRLCDKYRDPERLLEFIEKPRLFGAMTVSSMEISFHNWYDTRKQVVKILKL